MDDELSLGLLKWVLGVLRLTLNEKGNHPGDGVKVFLRHKGMSMMGDANPRVTNKPTRVLDRLLKVRWTPKRATRCSKGLS